MIFGDFKKIVDEFRARPMPGKHVYVWNGDKDSLLRIIGENRTEEIDLCKDIEIGAATNEVNESAIRRQIEKTLESKLFELYSGVQKRGKQQILIVLSSSILARYRIGLTVFYNYYLGDHTMVVFVVPVPKVLNDLNLPEYIRYYPDETLKYLGALAQPENIIGGK
jgi:hypothetical protein